MWLFLGPLLSSLLVTAMLDLGARANWLQLGGLLRLLVPMPVPLGFSLAFILMLVTGLRRGYFLSYTSVVERQQRPLAFLVMCSFTGIGALIFLAVFGTIVWVTLRVPHVV